MFKKFSIISITSIAAAILFVSTASAQSNTIVDIAVSNDNFSSLADAVVSQDLVETLASEGPFTVFAPTNDAFNRLPRVVKKALEIEPSLLTDILVAHVVAGDVRASQVVNLDNVTTLGNATLPVRVINGTVFIGSSAVTATDIVADNGVIHVINRVIIPRDVINKARRIVHTQFNFMNNVETNMYPTVHSSRMNSRSMNNMADKPCVHTNY